MAEETTQPQETEEKVTPSPKEELGDATKDLIKEALTEATDQTKPWYKRGASYLIAAALIIVFYLGDKVGDQVIDFLTTAIGTLLQAL